MPRPPRVKVRAYRGHVIYLTSHRPGRWGWTAARARRIVFADGSSIPAVDGATAISGTGTCRWLAWCDARNMIDRATTRRRVIR